MIRCEGCNRHIFARETACPFCAAPGRRLRTGLLAAGLVALAGCPAPVYGAPAEDIDLDARMVDAAISDAALADAAMADADVADAAGADARLGDMATPDMAKPIDMLPGDMANPTDMAADMPEADMSRAPDMQVDMFIALPPYGIPPEER